MYVENDAFVLWAGVYLARDLAADDEDGPREQVLRAAKISALLEQPLTVAAISAATGVKRPTIASWVRRDPEFARNYARAVRTAPLLDDPDADMDADADAIERVSRLPSLGKDLELVLQGLRPSDAFIAAALGQRFEISA